jgi:uncharacterized membrane protein YeaQ/YmgE (transglycosylase-associated protein family)
MTTQSNRGNEFRQPPPRFGALLKGVLGGSIAGLVVGVLTARNRSSGYLLIDALFMAVIGAVCGLVAGLVIDLYTRLKGK